MSKHHHKHIEETEEDLELSEQETSQPTEPEETPAQETKPDYYEQFVRLSADF